MVRRMVRRPGRSWLMRRGTSSGWMRYSQWWAGGSLAHGLAMLTVMMGIHMPGN
jgi:hypothetical protein